MGPKEMDDVEVIVIEPEDVVVLEISDEEEIIDLSDIDWDRYEFEDRVIELTNEVRGQHGLHPLSKSPQLMDSALAHSQDMASHHFISHTGSDGSNVAKRVTKAGYTNWTTVGENCAMGQRTPEEVIQGWLDSPGHRANLLNENFHELGVGYVEGEILTPVGFQFRGGYWTQNFGSRLNVYPVYKFEQQDDDSPIRSDYEDDEEIEILIEGD